MPRLLTARPAAVALAAGGLLVAIFAVLLLHFRGDLRAEIRRKIIERDASVLHPVALQQLGDAVQAGDSGTTDDALLAVLKSAQQSGMLGVAVFDASGGPLRAVPSTMLFVDLPADDYLELTHLTPISRYHPDFALKPTFGLRTAGDNSPVLEVLLPLYLPRETKLAGVAQYFIDARPLARELALIDSQVDRQTLVTLSLGATLIFLVVGVSYWGLVRAQRIIAERNERLVRANLELSLAAKASVLGQITSHLLHGLQGPVAGLRAVMASHGPREAGEDWRAAADYTDRLQAMIQETVALLGERSAQTSYELNGHDLAATLRERHRAVALARGVEFEVSGGFGATIDSNRGNLLCLAAGNLIENAIQACAQGGNVRVGLVLSGDTIDVTIVDSGEGIPDGVLQRLFQPGHSGKQGGTGLGLAISHLLALEIGAEIQLERTGPAGTTFVMRLDRAKR